MPTIVNFLRTKFFELIQQPYEVDRDVGAHLYTVPFFPPQIAAALRKKLLLRSLLRNNTNFSDFVVALMIIFRRKGLFMYANSR